MYNGWSNFFKTLTMHRASELLDNVFGQPYEHWVFLRTQNNALEATIKCWAREEETGRESCRDKSIRFTAGENSGDIFRPQASPHPRQAILTSPHRILGQCVASVANPPSPPFFYYSPLYLKAIGSVRCVPSTIPFYFASPASFSSTHPAF